MSRSHAVAADPIVATDFTAFSPPPTSRVSAPSFSSANSAAGVASERQPLLSTGRSHKKPFYRARPLWLVPFAILAALVRGMTIAPRVQVFTQLSCNALYHPYNHTTNDYASPLTYLPLLPISPSLSSSSPSHPTITRHRRLKSPSQECLRDPLVQAKAAQLQTITTTTMGLLSAFTNGWWGHFGERHGRTKILAIATFGWMLTDAVFMLVSTPAMPWSPYAHGLLLLSPVIEGSLGGWSLLQSATSAYVSDCTSPGSRARIFSRFTGVFYVGFSLGPILGGWIIRNYPNLVNSASNLTSVFAFAVAGSLLNLLLLLFVFPESLSKEQQAEAAQLYAESKAEPVEEGGKEGVHTKLLNGLISPLAIFLPVKEQSGRGRTDWSLTWVAFCLFGFYLSMGVFQLKYLYVEHVYGWESAQLGSYISFLGSARALYLIFGLPLIIAAFKPVVKPKSPPSPPPLRLQHQPHRHLDKLVIPPPPKRAAKAKLLSSEQFSREISFDLNLSRFSFLIDLVSQLAVLAVPAPTFHATRKGGSLHNQTLFVLASSLNSLGSGAAPSIQSLALCILQHRALKNGGQVDSGKLFGGIAVLQATGSMILGPLLFGMVYSGTVSDMPKAIFAVAGAVLFASLMFSLLVQTPKVDKKGKGKQRRVEEDEDVERGRSRVSKDLRKEPYLYYYSHDLQVGSSSTTTTY